MKKILQKVLQKFGYRAIKIHSDKNYNIAKEKGVNNSNSMSDALGRIATLISPDQVIDVGAAKGKWTEIALNYFPNAEYVLVEPIREQIEKISDVMRGNPKVKIIEGVAGKEVGEVELTITPDLDGSGIYGGKGENTRSVPVVTVNDVLKNNSKSVLLKLDTHGFEIPIFEGAANSLKKTDAIIVEVYGFQISPYGKLFHEISAYLMEQGFRLFDIVDVMRRPRDHVFWQADAVYLKIDHPVFGNNTYQ